MSGSIEEEGKTPDVLQVILNEINSHVAIPMHKVMYDSSAQSETGLRDQPNYINTLFKNAEQALKIVSETLKYAIDQQLSVENLNNNIYRYISKSGDGKFFVLDIIKGLDEDLLICIKGDSDGVHFKAQLVLWEDCIEVNHTIIGSKYDLYKMSKVYFQKL